MNNKCNNYVCKIRNSTIVVSHFLSITKFEQDFNIVKSNFFKKITRAFFIDNILNFIYEFILIVSRTINIEIHLKFRLYDVFLNHLNIIEKKIVNRLLDDMKKLIVKVCETINQNFSKYYFKIENKNDLIYNLVNILNSIIKTNIYEIWNKKKQTL